MAEHFINTLWRINGPRRCGNHAIRSWLTGCLKDVYMEANNLDDGKPSCYDSKSNTYIFKAHLAEHEFLRSVRNSDVRYAVSAYENINVVTFCGINCEIERFARNEGIVFGKVCTVLILRDWPNYVASVLKHNLNRGVAPHDPYMWRPDVWKSVARSGSLANVFVNFDEWFVRPSYRLKIATELGVPFSDSQLNAIAPYGSGSSFDGLKYNGNAQASGVLFRHLDRSVRQHPFFLEQMKDSEALSLSHQIFGDAGFER